jgi:hypothetical protein
MSKIIIGTITPKLGQKLTKLGVPENCRRVVIDLQVHQPAVIYYETYDDQANLDGMLDVVLKVKESSLG